MSGSVLGNNDLAIKEDKVSASMALHSSRRQSDNKQIIYDMPGDYNYYEKNKGIGSVRVRLFFIAYSYI